MPIPQIVIVGRPNVGKSSVFNWLAGRRIAIVDPTAGVTRDRLSQLVELGDRYVELVDTGGIGIVDADQLSEHVERQIQTAIDSADVILFLVDVREGVTPLDEEVNRRLRVIEAPVVCVANKSDGDALDRNADEFCRFGRKILAISARENRHKEDLLAALYENLPPADATEQELADPVMKLAIVGRRNVGKSTFVNTLVQSERMIVSEVPGTTRDSVDVRFEMGGKAFLAIDTPGLRRSKNVSTDLDFYSLHRAQRSIRRADVVLLFFDAAEPISKVDMQLADYIMLQYKPCIFVVNKWDLLVDKADTSEWGQYLHDTFPTLSYAPIAFITGQTGKNIRILLNHAQMLFKQSRERAATSYLNKVIRAALERNPPPLYKNHRARVYYATQVGVQPPTVVLFANNPKALSPDYQRYLLTFLRDTLEFGEVPIKLYVRERSTTDKSDEIDGKIGK